MPLVNSYIPDSQLYHDLKAMGRDNFSYDGAKALMEYLERLSDDIGENIEYDPISFCCDYSEYKSRAECAEEYGDDVTADNLEDHTTVIQFEGGVIIQNF